MGKYSIGSNPKSTNTREGHEIVGRRGFDIQSRTIQKDPTIDERETVNRDFCPKPWDTRSDGRIVREDAMGEYVNFHGQKIRL